MNNNSNNKLTVQCIAMSHAGRKGNITEDCPQRRVSSRLIGQNWLTRPKRNEWKIKRIISSQNGNGRPWWCHFKRFLQLQSIYGVGGTTRSHVPAISTNLIISCLFRLFIWNKSIIMLRKMQLKAPNPLCFNSLIQLMLNKSIIIEEKIQYKWFNFIITT